MDADKKSSGGFFASLGRFLPFSNCKPTVTEMQSPGGSAVHRHESSCPSSPVGTYKDEPVEREELGRNTWCLLHTMAAYLPDEISNEERKELKSFMSTLGKFYPCDVCAHELSNSLKANPPDIKNRHSFCQWMCRLHNGVNERLGKPQFDCSRVDERWRDGWKDGVED